MKNYEIISMHDLQLFAEGGPAGGAAAGTDAGGTGVNAPAAGVQTGVNDHQQTGNPATDGAPAAEVQNQTEQTAVDLNAEFETLIKGKYKDQYNARVKDTVQKRLKATNEMAEKYKALTPMFEILAQRYGVDVTDIDGLNAAVQEDDYFYEDEAFERNMSVKQLKEIKKMEREIATLRRDRAETKRQEEGQRIYNTWMQQAEAAKLKFPNLDLAIEIQNPEFMNLLRANVGVEAAYQVIHQDDIIAGAMQAAARTAAQKTANSVAANAARPNENGTGQGAATVKPDVSKMTKAQRQDYIRRAARGETITFR